MNRSIRVLKAVSNFALDKEMVERNVMARFRQYEGRGERAVKRAAFEEGEIRALLGAARPHERALIGLLCSTEEVHRAQDRRGQPQGRALRLARRGACSA